MIIILYVSYMLATLVFLNNCTVITQWSVFAMQNLLENNAENKQIVAGLKMEGVADNTAFLRDLGMEAHMKPGEKVVLKGSKKDMKGPFKGSKR